MALTKLPIFFTIAALIFLVALTVSASTIEIQFSPNDSVALREGNNTTVTIEFADTAHISFTPIVSMRDTTGFTSATFTRHENFTHQVFLRASLIIAPGYANLGSYGIKFVALDSLADSVAARLYITVWDSLRPETLSAYTADSSGQPMGTVKLAWNAPHEDSTLGSAVAKYHLRYSTTAPGNPQTWWNAADSIPILTPTPLIPGQQQIVYVSGLAEYQSRWFGIRSEDAAGNLSAISVRGPARPRHQLPVIQLLGDIPDTVKPDSTMHFTGMASDSGGVLATIRYSGNGTLWSAVQIDSTRDSSAVFIRKYFHFTQASSASDSIAISVRALDSRDSTTYRRVIKIDRTHPNHPTITPGQDSLTSNNLFEFSGTKDRDAAIWTIITIGSSTSDPQRVTAPGDTALTWDYSDNVYYQGLVSFAFYAADPVGNCSDTVRFNYFLIPNPPNIIDTTTVNYHNSTVFNPSSDSFLVSFRVNQISHFSLRVVDDLGALVYQSNLDSLTVGEHSISWQGIMNQQPDSGAVATDGRYLASFSARTYPVNPYDLPITVQLILDSNSPFLIDLTPNSNASGTEPRAININTGFALVVGDTGILATNSKAEILAPYFEYGESGRLEFTPSETAPNRWLANLSTIDPPLTPGNYSMTLVIADGAGNENRYVKSYVMTAETGISDFRNAPNPFAPSIEQTRIVYTLGRSVSELILEIFDSAGDLVFRQKLSDNNLLPGNPEIFWDGRSAWGKKLNNGVYFARLTGDIKTDFIKIAIVDR
jgi:flagellar hook assembly protein FlgD